MTEPTAPAPSAELIAEWAAYTGGEQTTARLAAAAALAAGELHGMLDRSRQGGASRVEVDAIAAQKVITDAARQTLADYLGEALADMPTPVRYAAGYR